MEEGGGPVGGGGRSRVEAVPLVAVRVVGGGSGRWLVPGGGGPGWGPKFRAIFSFPDPFSFFEAFQVFSKTCVGVLGVWISKNCAKHTSLEFSGRDAFFLDAKVFFGIQKMELTFWKVKSGKGGFFKSATQKRQQFKDVRFYPILNFGHFWAALAKMSLNFSKFLGRLRRHTQCPLSLVSSSVSCFLARSQSSLSLRGVWVFRL